MLKEIKLNKEEKITKIEVIENGVIFYTTETQIKITDYHEQDCCEEVYADFEVIKYYLPQINLEKVKSIKLKLVEDIGFIIILDKAEV